MSIYPDEIVSIIGTAYLSPIKRLMEHLFTTKIQTRYKVQSGSFENGYSSSIILLWVAMLESFTVRLRYLHGSNISGKKHALEVIEALCPNIRHKMALMDVFVVRDLIFHNHLWSFEYMIGNNPPLILKDSNRDKNYGDKKFHDRVNFKTLRTKALRLNINPIRIDRYDVLQVAKTVIKTLICFQQKDYNIVPSLKYRFRNNGEYLSWEDYLEKLAESA